MDPADTTAAADTDDIRDLALRVKAASRKLASSSEGVRHRILEGMARAIEQAASPLMEANAEDVRAAEQRIGEDALPAATMERLRLHEGKLQEMAQQIRSVAALPDPLGRVLDAIELDDHDPPGSRGSRSSMAGNNGAIERDVLPRENAPPEREPGLRLQKVAVPLGVLLVIFEARPDAVTQIAALAVKSGNAVILKAGREVEQTAAALVAVLREALPAEGLPEDIITLVTGREPVSVLLQAHDLVDLVIPRGSRQLVEYVQANTRIPVLGHAEGICHIYVDRAADAELALRVIADAKLDYPAACNAVETVLVHEAIAPAFLPRLLRELEIRAVRVHGDAAVRAIAEDAAVLPVGEWHTEYGDAELSMGVVDSLDAAIAHIHRHGSLHTESILTEDTEAAERFLREVDAAGVFHNASTRFADGFRYGFGAEVGVSTSKLHARGPVGLEGLTTYKYLLRGAGHIAGDYRGSNARAFTHRRKHETAAGS